MDPDMSYPTTLLPSAERIEKHLLTQLDHTAVYVYDTIDSTNTQARRLIDEGASLPFVAVAHEQTAGKGRLGRSFHSPRGSGLYMTLGLDLLGELDRIATVTPIAAVAAAEAIEEICGKRPAIKWVNDLYLDGKKICGILTEAVPFEGGHHILVGIGINVTTRDFPAGLRNPAGAVLAEEDAPVDQSLLCARIIQKLLCGLLPERAEDSLRAYRERMAFVGERVICTRQFPSDGQPITDGTEGVLIGVDDQYGLLLRRDDGTVEALRGGEISLTVK